MYCDRFSGYISWPNAGRRCRDVSVDGLVGSNGKVSRSQRSESGTRNSSDLEKCL